jgi:hypothetical protein
MITGTKFWSARRREHGQSTCPKIHWKLWGGRQVIFMILNPEISIPRAARNSHNTNGVAELSPGLPDSERATLGNDPFPPHPFRAQRGACRAIALATAEAKRVSPAGPVQGVSPDFGRTTPFLKAIIKPYQGESKSKPAYHVKKSK